MAVLKKDCDDAHSGLSERIGQVEAKLNSIDLSKMESDREYAQSIVIDGVPEELGDNLLDYFSDMFKVMKADISMFQNMGRTQRANGKSSIRLLLESEEKVKKVLKLKRNLRGSEKFKDVFINPYLNPKEKKLDFNLRALAQAIPGVRYAGGAVFKKK